MTQQFLYLVLANSLWCLGIHYLFTESFMKRIGDWLTDYFTEKNLYWLTKPMFNCMPCMASIHGIIWYYYFYGTINLIYLVVLLGLNILVSKYYYNE